MSSTTSSANTSPSTSPLLQGRDTTLIDSSFGPTCKRVDSAFDDNRRSQKIRAINHLLMRENPPQNDPTYNEQQARARRRIKAHVFDDVHLDWRSAPAVEETPFNSALLMVRQDLRCNASRQYLYQVRDDIRQQQLSTITASSDSNGTLMIDGEVVVDMIG